MKAWLSVAAISLLGGFCAWQHFQMRQLNAQLAAKAHEVDKLVSGHLVDELIKGGPSGRDITLALAHAMADAREAGRVDIIERYQDGRRVLRYEGSSEFDKRIQNLNFRMVRPAHAAPGSRQADAVRYENVVLEPTELPAKDSDRLPYGLYGR